MGSAAYCLSSLPIIAVAAVYIHSRFLRACAITSLQLASSFSSTTDVMVTVTCCLALSCFISRAQALASATTALPLCYTSDKKQLLFLAPSASLR